MGQREVKRETFLSREGGAHLSAVHQGRCSSMCAGGSFPFAADVTMLSVQPGVVLRSQASYK
eukprot:49293-Eustigmatos_ZCMA.PRE.1